jgi:small subunit ribosomal protein S8e
MGVYHERDTKKPSGGKRRYNYKVKRKALFGRYFVPTILASEGEKEVRKKIRVRGGGFKLRLKRVVFANVIDKKTGKAFKAKILEIVETPANREYKRRNIITKGTVIKTEKGDAVVISRPGQDGVINAILIS